MSVIRDAVWGDIELNKLELEIINTSVFQRLRYIKQLGTTNLVYPTALHTRFDHSIGTLFITQKIINFITKKQDVDKTDVLFLRIASLVHDVTHIPFGHTLEDESRIFKRHDKDKERWEKIYSNSTLKKILIREGIYKEIKEIILGKEDSFISDIVKGCISADLLDYLKRDSYFCGLNIGYDERLFRYFSIINNRLVIKLNKNGIFRYDAFTEVVNLLRARYIMTERIYYHHTKIASSIMISKLVQAAAENGFSIEDIYQLGDDTLLYKIGNFVSNDLILRRLKYNIINRKLFKRCFLHKSHDIPVEKIDDLYLNKRKIKDRVEKKIAKKLKISFNEIGLYCSPANMYLKEADALCEMAPNKIMMLKDINSFDIKAISQKHRGIWKIYLFISEDRIDLSEKAGIICQEELEIKNELPSERQGHLSLWD